MCIAKCLLVLVSTFYLLDTLLYDIAGPIIWYLANQRSAELDSSRHFSHFLIEINFVMSLTDFLSSMAILYMIHRFGPYRQYLRQSEMI